MIISFKGMGGGALLVGETAASSFSERERKDTSCSLAGEFLLELSFVLYLESFIFYIL